jgi:putative phosphoribosyl transferase
LGTAVLKRLGQEPALVLGLPRGGVPVAAGVARALGCDLDVLVVRKVGVPGQPELAMGAVGPGGVTVRNAEVLGMLPDAARRFEAVAVRERAEVERRERAYRGERAPLAVAGRTVVLVDDGVATGATLRAAIKAARALGSSRVVVAVPVAAPDAVRRLAAEADEVICLDQPAYLAAVGQSYEDFSQVTDAEVRDFLAAP